MTTLQITFSGLLSKPSSEFGSPAAVSSFLFFIFKGLIKKLYILVKWQMCFGNVFKKLFTGFAVILSWVKAELLKICRFRELLMIYEPIVLRLWFQHTWINVSGGNVWLWELELNIWLLWVTDGTTIISALLCLTFYHHEILTVKCHIYLEGWQWIKALWNQM